MLKQVLGGDRWVYPEFLWQVAEYPSQQVRLREYICTVESNAAGGRNLQCRENTHESRFASAVGPEQTEHPWRNVEIDAVESLDAARIGLAKGSDLQCAAACPGIDAGGGGCVIYHAASLKQRRRPD